MARLDTNRQTKLEPKRIEKAIFEISKLGYNPTIKGKSILFTFRGNTITFWPYSGWHSGKGIVAGRGLDNLLKQIIKFHPIHSIHIQGSHYIQSNTYDIAKQKGQKHFTIRICKMETLPLSEQKTRQKNKTVIVVKGYTNKQEIANEIAGKLLRRLNAGEVVGKKEVRATERNLIGV